MDQIIILRAMKKHSLPFFFSFLLLLPASFHAQSFVEGFEAGVPVGWDTVNNSSPRGGTGWFDGAQAAVFAPQSGADFIAANFNNTDSLGTISNWLISPKMYLNNSDKIIFYTRTTDSSSTVYPDRLQVRLSTNGSSTDVGTTATSTGDFTTLLLEINPGLTVSGYPFKWTKYTITLSGLGSSNVPGRFAFRYFVTNAGSDGSNSDFIGIDSLAYQSVANGLFERSVTASFNLLPNPSNGRVTLDASSTFNGEIQVLISDVLGNSVFTSRYEQARAGLDLGHLPKGIYFVTVSDAEGHSGTRRLIVF